MPRALVTTYLLMLGVFCVGTAEIVISGLLPLVSNDLDVSVSMAGLLVTGYAVGVTIAGPLVTLASTAVRRHALIFTLLAIFIIGNLATFLAPTYELVMAARLVSSFTHGTYVALAFGIAGAMSDPNKQGAAMARISLGFNLANALGGPLGAFIGQNLGWRATFLFIAAFSAVTLIALVFFIPRNLPTPDRLTFAVIKGEARELKNVSVMVAVVITVLAQAAVFASSTYIVTSLEEVAGFASSTVPILLVVFGVGAICGNFAGGRLADAFPKSGSLIAVAAVLVGSLLWWAGLFLEATAFPALFLFGAMGFSIIPALQARVLAAAQFAPTLALSLNVSAFNLGNGLGALAGGLALDAFGGNATIIPLSGAALAALSLVIGLIYAKISAKVNADLGKGR